MAIKLKTLFGEWEGEKVVANVSSIYLFHTKPTVAASE